MSEASWGFAHFLAQTDTIGLCVLAVLVAMSLLSWYLIAAKLWSYMAIRARSKAFLASFRAVHHPVDAERLWVQRAADNPFARLLGEGLGACLALREAKRDNSRKGDEFGFGLAAPDDYMSAALAHGVASEARGLENGLTALASIASSAPFVGLFGTVWGIFHALRDIALSSQASLDKVAGPVGEALIMTACGLFVAIPAVLAYNAFTRLNRNLCGEMENHAHAIFGLLGLGQTAGGAARVVELSSAPAKAEGAH
ncbi:MAG: MotA/TolQ/ExbB proton channel family protein [Azoarcus sp.]|jgi:biopolymer transport protein ExbB|nr:MotA/TolQ/ExbB proton channel family protein [Azoarcus sp.]